MRRRWNTYRDLVSLYVSMRFIGDETMIIFDLDGTLADCEHRRHFVVKQKKPECTCDPESYGYDGQPCAMYDYLDCKPDWQAFYEACDKDTVISQTRCLFDFVAMNGHAHQIQIWSGRCESVREKTIAWLKNWSFGFAVHPFDIILKMRPIGDNTPDDQLKEKWLDEALANSQMVNFVFDSCQDSIAMWRKRGIFVFNVNQSEQEF